MLTNSLTKFIYFLILFSSVTSFSEEDVEGLYGQYRTKSEDYHEDLQGFGRTYFQLLAQTSMMQRVRNFKNIIGAGSGGFVFTADYMNPNVTNGDWIKVAVKILPDDRSFRSFNENTIQVVLTGNRNNDAYNPSIMRPFSYDQSEGRIEVNTSGDKNRYTEGISKFYEMQKSTLVISSFEKQYVTVLITEIGLMDMHDPLFSRTSQPATNTQTMLRYFLEITKGAMNINKQGILHGDIKPANIILVKRSDEMIHPEHIDFDLILDPKQDKLLSHQLRYTPGYRAPWIKAILKNIIVDVSKPPVTEKYYQFDRLFREDSFAVGKTILKLISTNLNAIDRNNKTLINLSNYVNDKVVNSAIRGPEFVPTTEQFYDQLKQLMENEEVVEKNVISIDSNSTAAKVSNQRPASGMNQKKFQRAHTQFQKKPTMNLVKKQDMTRTPVQVLMDDKVIPKSQMMMHPIQRNNFSRVPVQKKYKLVDHTPTIGMQGQIPTTTNMAKKKIVYVGTTHTRQQVSKPTVAKKDMRFI